MNIQDNIKKRGGRTITTTRNNTDSTSNNRKKKNNRKQKWEEKQLYGHFKRETSEISHEKTWTLVRKRNLQSETESLFISAQNNAIDTVKARIDKKRQNSTYILCSDRDGTINHIINKCSKLKQKEFETRHD